VENGLSSAAALLDEASFANRRPFTFSLGLVFGHHFAVAFDGPSVFGQKGVIDLALHSLISFIH
jgi:hypothetical protein